MSYYEVHLVAPWGLNTGGMGCVCGWQCPSSWWFWPKGFWWNRWWDEHLVVCPLERDSQGRVINW